MAMLLTEVLEMSVIGQRLDVNATALLEMVKKR